MSNIPSSIDLPAPFNPHFGETSRWREFYHLIVDSGFTQASAQLIRTVLPAPHVSLTEHSIVVPNLPVELDGCRILHVSDLHLRAGSELAREVPALVADVRPDYTLYTGDFIDDDNGIDPVIELLKQMPVCKKSFAVLGNHDYMPLGRTHGTNDVRRLTIELSAIGIKVLFNTNSVLDEHGLYVVGVDDPATKRDNLDSAFASIAPDAATILLAHSPDILLRIGSHRPSLTLCGHTHGGQIRLPVAGALLTMSKLSRDLSMGLHVYQGLTVFISRGIGYSGLDLRFRCPSEVTVLTLRQPAA